MYYSDPGNQSMANKDNGFTPIVRINLDHVRHAFSCANVIYAAEEKYRINNVKNAIKNFTNIGILQNDRARITPDSVLSDIGIMQSMELGETYRDRFLKTDLFITSELRRCIETGLISCRAAFKGSDIKTHDTMYVIPYVAEIDTMYDNCAIEFNKRFMERNMHELLDKSVTVPMAQETRAYGKAYIEKHYPVSNDYLKIDNKILLNNDKINHNGKPAPTVSDHDKFYSDVIPYIYGLLSDIYDPNQKLNDKQIPEYNVMLFTHSGHIRSHFGLDGKPLTPNNITKDNRFKHEIDQYVPSRKKPHNTNIFTEIIEMDNQGRIRVMIANPCTCQTNISMKQMCTKPHQILLRDQVVTKETKWCSVDANGIKRCGLVHNEFSKYGDRIRKTKLSDYKDMDPNPDLESDLDKIKRMIEMYDLTKIFN